MSSPQRPVFHEGQILAASDLTASVDHGRDGQARHDRHLHTWGIAGGLELTKVDKRDPASNQRYVEVTLQRGVLVDGTGREVLVTEPVRLDEAVFERINGANPDPTARYPVLLRGLDADAPRPALSAEACGANGQPVRVTEGFEVTFGRLGDELELEEQPAPAVDSGPGGAANQRPWHVLLGFVTWSGPNLNRFTEVLDQAGGVRRRYAGVLADTVAARSGRLVLQTRPGAEASRPAVMVDDADATLAYGLYDGAGGLQPLFTVNADGDVAIEGGITAKGTISGPLTIGSVQVQSGVATDGVVLPLPVGVTEQQVAEGKVTLHVRVTPHVPGSALPDATNLWGQFPLECEVDDERRVRCRVRWLRLGGAARVVDRPAACDYLVVAAASGGGGP